MTRRSYLRAPLFIGSWALLVSLADCHHRTDVNGLTVQVPASPPDTVPSWFRDDSSFVSVPRRGRFLRGVVSVLFVESATQVQREKAITLVGGKVIGGEPAVDHDGFYYLRVPDDGTGAQLQQAVDVLNHLSQVEIADLVAPGGTAHGQKRSVAFTAWNFLAGILVLCGSGRSPALWPRLATPSVDLSG